MPPLPSVVTPLVSTTTSWYFAVRPKECKCSNTSSYLFCKNIWYLDKKQLVCFCSTICMTARSSNFFISSLQFSDGFHKSPFFSHYFNASIWELRNGVDVGPLLLLIFSNVYVFHLTRTLRCIMSKYFYPSFHLLSPVIWTICLRLTHKQNNEVHNVDLKPTAMLRICIQSLMLFWILPANWTKV